VDPPTPPPDGGAELGGSLWRRATSARTLVSFGIAAAILWFVVRRLDVEPAALAAQLKQANPVPLAVAFLLWYGAFFVRGWRWGFMVRGSGAANGPGQSVPPVRDLAGIILLAYFANSLVPAKLGDAYRAYLLKRDGGVALSAGFGTILAERLVDAMMIVVVLASSALVVFGTRMPEQATPALVLGGLVLVGGACGLGLMWLTRHSIVRILPDRLKAVYIRLQGAVFGSLRRPGVVFGIGLLLWLGDGMRVWFVTRALDANISPAVAIFVAVMGALLTVVPFTPAGLGVVELGVGSVLIGVLGVDPVVAGSIIVLDRIVTYWSLLLVGGALYLWRTRQEFRGQNAAAPGMGPTP
jgi:uncharacterized membrane protein YbhN (UPF0104 family)